MSPELTRSKLGRSLIICRNSVFVEFVVRPDGLADPTSVEISGSSDQTFARNVLRFVTESRFIPGRVIGCNVLSKYNLVIKPMA